MVIDYKDMSIDISRRIVKRAGVDIVLRNREFELLCYFLRNPGIIFSKRKLLEEVWDRNACLNTTTVESHMSTLRKKLDHGFNEKLFHTVYCAGYKIE